MSEFHFLRPDYFYLLLPLAVLLFALWRLKLANGGWSKVCDKNLLPYILQGEVKKNLFAFASLLLMGLLTITALAGPTWEKVSLPLIQEKSGLVIALDLSPAMNSEDLKPSRLQRAIYKVDDILKKRREGQTALIVYTDEAFVVTPLTDDVRTISALLPALDTSIMPTHGLNHDKAIAKAAELIRQGGISNGSILLITSGSVAEFADAGYPVSILGIGTEQGAPVPKGDGGFMLDEKGGVIISKMDRAKLKKLAEATGGRFALVSADESDIRSLLRPKAGNYGTTDSQTHWQWLDGGYWLVLISLPLAAFLLRRGFLAITLLLFTCRLQAGVWSTGDQKGQQLFEQEAYAEAAEEFTNPSWQGAAYYKAKNYIAAARCYKQDTTPDGYYNLGNCLAMQGEIDEAIAAYEKTLELEPDHEDAAYNKKLLEEKKKNKQEKQDQQNGDQDKSDQDKQDGDQDQSGQDKQDGDQDKSDQDKQDGDQNKQNNQNKSDQDKQKNKSDDQDKQDGKPDNQDIKQEDKEEYSEEVDKELQNQPEGGQEEQMAECDPQREIDDRWLERVPDDPGGLLRRKFLYQYKKGRS